MSIRAKRSPMVSEILKVLGAPELRRVDRPKVYPADQPLPSGTGRYSREGRSTRGVMLTSKPGIARVRMFPLSSLEDWELGFQLLRALAADPAVRVEGEDGTVSTLSDMRERFLEVLHRETANDFREIQKQLREHPETVVVLDGAVREVFIGPRQLAELSTGTTGGVTAVVERIRRIQHIEREGFEVVRPVKLAVEPGRLFSRWTLDKAQAFEATDYVVLEQPWRNSIVCVPVPGLPELVGSRFQWLDEKQFTLQPIPESERADLHERAMARVTVYHPRKRWWQFWR
jgi:hypothetical protein